MVIDEVESNFVSDALVSEKEELCKKNDIGAIDPKENGGNVMASFEDKSEIQPHENDLVQELSAKEEVENIVISDLIFYCSMEKAQKIDGNLVNDQLQQWDDCWHDEQKFILISVHEIRECNVADFDHCADDNKSKSQLHGADLGPSNEDLEGETLVSLDNHGDIAKTYELNSGFDIQYNNNSLIWCNLDVHEGVWKRQLLVTVVLDDRPFDFGSTNMIWDPGDVMSISNTLQYGSLKPNQLTDSVCKYEKEESSLDFHENIYEIS